MSGKTSIPIVIGIGALALLLSRKKKSQQELIRSPEYINLVFDPAGDERIQFDKECAQIVNKLNFDDHNNWLTNRYYQLLAEGMTDLDAMTVQLLRDQSDHCPWEDPQQWTDLMLGLYNQLNAAVKEWHERTGGNGLAK